MVYIYELIDTRDGQTKYIGKTSDLKVRYYNHISDGLKKYNTKKISWIKHLRKNNLKPILNVIDEVPEETQNFWEQFYIQLYRSWNIKLKNGTEGGDGGKTCDMIWNKGKKMSDDVKQKCQKSFFKKGNIPWNKGKVGIYSEETRRKIADKLKGVKLSPEICEKRSKAAMGKNNRSVVQIDFVSGKILSIYKSMSEAKEIVGVEISKICAVCLGKRNKTGGFKWRYIEDVSEEEMLDGFIR